MLPDRRPYMPTPPLTAMFLLAPISLALGGAWFGPATCLVAIASALERDHRTMLACYGLALGFDPQAVLIAPFFASLLIQRRVPLKLLPIGLLCAAAMLLAQQATGITFAPVFPLDIALSQGSPNLWVVATAIPGIGGLPLIGLALTATIGAAAAITAWFSARPVADRVLLDAALLCSLVMAMLAPGTDIGVLALANVLAVMLAVGTGDTRRWHVAGLLLAGSGATLVLPADMLPLAGTTVILATLLHARAVLRPAANDNPLMARTA